MPGFDRRGPNGEGPKTGRGLGKCGGNVQINENFGAERPMRRRLRDASCDLPHQGRGRGRGICRHG
jgi:hypothetical protein